MKYVLFSKESDKTRLSGFSAMAACADFKRDSLNKKVTPFKILRYSFKIYRFYIIRLFLYYNKFNQKNKWLALKIGLFLADFPWNSLR